MGGALWALLLVHAGSSAGVRPSRGPAPLRRAFAFRAAAVLVSPLAAPSCWARYDCLETARRARTDIQDLLEFFEETKDPSPLRPTAKAILNGPLRGCLNDAVARGDAAAPHARDALEFIATVVEFDAYDKLTKEYEPKSSQVYTPAKIEYSLKALRAADRELASFVSSSAR
ncbi:hypothetical protein M885DRAFT_507021 [Pelagophyceae sp. CCMP2097]|nr:hypothetical protein M885DRAFT_507021 [Pelagophyceae sp. CCMP2097]